MRPVRLVDAAPDLLPDGLSDDEEREARAVVAPTVRLDRGRWGADPGVQTEPGHAGLLVVDGLLTRDVTLGEVTATELIGRGDMLRPADFDGEFAPVPFDMSWNVLLETTVAVLDRRVSTLIGRSPAMTAAIVKAGIRRVHSLAVHLAICHMRRVDSRLLVLMWHFADRWGHVEREGVVMPFRLTHEMIGRIIGAQRPSVTTALKRLSEEELLERRADGSWLLRGGPPEELENLRPSARADRHCGEGAQ